MIFWTIYCLTGAACSCMDLKNRYIPVWMLVPACLLLTLRFTLSYSLVFCLLMSLAYPLCRQWIGSADVAAFWFLALYFGTSFFLILIAACLVGMVYSRHDPCIPFVACLFTASMLLAPGCLSF